MKIKYIIRIFINRNGIQLIILMVTNLFSKMGIELVKDPIRSLVKNKSINSINTLA